MEGDMAFNNQATTPASLKGSTRQMSKDSLAEEQLQKSSQYNWQFSREKPWRKGFTRDLIQEQSLNQTGQIVIDPERIARVVMREVAPCDQREIGASLKEEFEALVNQWRRETRYLSSATKMAMHPAYQRIISLGEEVIPYILKDLQHTRAHWLWALYILTEFHDPAPEGATFDEAVDAWLNWGRQQGLLK